MRRFELSNTTRRGVPFEHKTGVLLRRDQGRGVMVAMPVRRGRPRRGGTLMTTPLAELSNSVEWNRSLAALRRKITHPLLVGTWADAGWAIRFYEKHGFRLVSWEEKERLLRRYWPLISARQVETSVVLADRWPL